MHKENYNVIGVMSGTSLDGVDVAHINLTLANGKWTYTIYEADTIAYDTQWINTLKAAVDYTAHDLEQLNVSYTQLLGYIIRNFIDIHNLDTIDAVCSHGHTILHQPNNGITLQIGNLPSVAAYTGQKVVCDFRIADVMLGGQGAPLVPIGDRLLFPSYDYCLNLGGFSNLSFEHDGKRLAYDICPVNIVLNHYAHQLGMDYDDKGNVAAGGSICKPLLAELDKLAFYNAPYPKSLGLEFVKKEIFPLIEKYEITIEDKLSTFTEHIAGQLANALGEAGSKSMLITGGGVYNEFLINKLKIALPSINITIPDDNTIQYKEALIFALLGVLKLRGDVNVLSSVTGAVKDHSSGHIFEP
jgi:anhydro-N-acetylmuramic acid kinase